MRPFGEAKSFSGHQTLQLMRRTYGVKGSVYVVTLLAFQRCLEDGPDAVEPRPASGFPTGRGIGDDRTKHNEKEGSCIMSSSAQYEIERIASVSNKVLTQLSGYLGIAPPDIEERRVGLNNQMPIMSHTILDLANSGADGDSPIDSTDSDLDALAHKHMDRDVDSDVSR
ncbi:hypothetical protein HAX54_006630 [Datura stramonium]|uniref:Uncharacterized protein n=1 Tax=Datura stramonium TaxID=4076 RepID=A0ABS8WWN0_DATST|nr:hypothetical protein [Datura stramonium]